MANETAQPARLLRLPEVTARVALGRTTIYDRVAAGTFPRPVAIGGNRVAWLESEINAWISRQVTASRQAAGVA